MKEYKKQYEDLYSDEYLKRVKRELISNDIGISNLEYVKLFKNTMLDYQKKSFDFLVKYYWLVRKFLYKGKFKNVKKGGGMDANMAFFSFFHRDVGISSRVVSGNYVLVMISSYLDDFFPDFDARDPFKEKMKYPYKHINFGHLFLVHKMEERMDLLKIAEKRKMKYADFLNYISNYICCYNEEHGERFALQNSKHSPLIPIYVTVWNKNKKK